MKDTVNTLKYGDNEIVLVFKKDKRGHHFTVVENEIISKELKGILTKLQERFFTDEEIDFVAKCIIKGIKNDAFVNRNYGCFQKLIKMFEEKYHLYPFNNVEPAPIVEGFRWYWAFMDNNIPLISADCGEDFTPDGASIDLLMQALDISWEELI